MNQSFSFLRAFLLLSFTFGSLILSGCAPLLIAGGAVGGYAIAKNLDNPPPPAPQSQGNKGLFGGK